MFNVQFFNKYVRIECISELGIREKNYSQQQEPKNYCNIKIGPYNNNNNNVETFLRYTLSFLSIFNEKVINCQASLEY